tara:strand:+ start:784 stop:1194 length:411 start_codon:yes stop_codon:yes gene_type:complete
MFKILIVEKIKKLEDQKKHIEKEIKYKKRIGKNIDLLNLILQKMSLLVHVSKYKWEWREGRHGDRWRVNSETEKVLSVIKQYAKTIRVDDEREETFLSKDDLLKLKYFENGPNKDETEWPEKIVWLRNLRAQLATK